MATRIQFPRLISRGPIEATQLGRAEANGNMRSKESGRGRSRFRNEADHGSGAKTISDTRLNAISNRPVLNEKSSGSSCVRVIHKREIVVVPKGRRVHLDRNDLDRWIEANKE